ncbi:hypothetical protein PoB_000193300 [Plakobranchus ocellatus]|uniref:Uncharacterized protein n=1 Tax=Plakobranchus ocellatus TaxID=259542 RepID=A0AAV3XZM7_9GAST|nr:hypothetical protein PoB_000193300 [Plakobranchus ocellatus]
MKHGAVQTCRFASRLDNRVSNSQGDYRPSAPVLANAARLSDHVWPADTPQSNNITFKAGATALAENANISREDVSCDLLLKCQPCIVYLGDALDLLNKMPGADMPCRLLMVKGAQDIFRDQYSL